MPICAVIIGLLLLGIPQTADVSGKVLDRAGKPLANARVVYTNIDTGKTYKFKTDKKGEFSGAGIIYGVYQIEITGSDGTSLYKTKRRIVDPNTPDFKKDTNTLTADLSIISVTDLPGGIQANVSPGDTKLSNQQKELIRANNANVEKMNDLIRRLHPALEAQQWPEATEILKQLIAADPNRWEFYQNLGTVQNNQSQYEDAASNYERGIELVQSGVSTGPQPDKKDISLMMIYAGDAYARLGNADKAVEFYSKASEISPDPATAYFNICRAQRSAGNTDSAVQACNKAISIDSKRWEFYQTLGAIQQNAGQDQLAIETYEKGIQVGEKILAGPAERAVGQMLSAEGSAYLNLKKFDEAINAFTRAAELDAYPARDYFNICATLYNTDRMEAAVGACDKAIAEDAKMADAYFVKASALYGKSKLEHGRLTVPEGTQEALSKYLELDPEGHNAANAREMLTKIGSVIDTTVRPRSK